MENKNTNGLTRMYWICVKFAQLIPQKEGGSLTRKCMSGTMVVLLCYNKAQSNFNGLKE